MTPQSPWITIWQTILSLGLGSFFLLVLIVLPLGAIDIRRLFQSLDEDRHEPQ